jgi:hypothetical protein
VLITGLSCHRELLWLEQKSLRLRNGHTDSWRSTNARKEKEEEGSVEGTDVCHKPAECLKRHWSSDLLLEGKL